MRMRDEAALPSSHSFFTPSDQILQLKLVVFSTTLLLEKKCAQKGHETPSQFSPPPTTILLNIPLPK